MPTSVFIHYPNIYTKLMKVTWAWLLGRFNWELGKINQSLWHFLLSWLLISLGWVDKIKLSNIIKSLVTNESTARQYIPLNVYLFLPKRLNLLSFSEYSDRHVRCSNSTHTYLLKLLNKTSDQGYSAQY